MMNKESLIAERLEFALGRLDLTSSYHQMILSMGERHLNAQLDHYKFCNPPIHLPFLCCEAFGVDPKHAVGVASSWFLLQVAAHLLDKVEDQELEVIGVRHSNRDVYTNLSTGMIFVAEWILNHLELDNVDAGAAWDIQRAFQETVLTVCSGQHLDLSLVSPDLSTCWHIAEAKSGSAFGLACYVGARTATHQTDQLRSMENFGRCLGTIVQISDDIEDLGRNVKNTLSPLANAYLTQVSLNKKADLIKSITHKSEDQSVNGGLVLYLRLEALKYAEMARNELKTAQLSFGPREQILKILNHLAWLGANVN